MVNPQKICCPTPLWCSNICNSLSPFLTVSPNSSPRMAADDFHPQLLLSHKFEQPLGESKVMHDTGSFHLYFDKGSMQSEDLKRMLQCWLLFWLFMQNPACFRSNTLLLRYDVLFFSTTKVVMAEDPLDLDIIDCFCYNSDTLVNCSHQMKTHNQFGRRWLRFPATRFDVPPIGILCSPTPLQDSMLPVPPHTHLVAGLENYNACSFHYTHAWCMQYKTRSSSVFTAINLVPMSLGVICYLTTSCVQERNELEITKDQLQFNKFRNFMKEGSTWTQKTSLTLQRTRVTYFLQPSFGGSRRSQPGLTGLIKDGPFVKVFIPFCCHQLSTSTYLSTTTYLGEQRTASLVLWTWTRCHNQLNLSGLSVCTLPLSILRLPRRFPHRVLPMLRR